MVSRKQHGQISDCPIALGLDSIGDHWSLLIVRDLLFGKHEFREFLDSDESISSNILTDRLGKLQEQGIVAWRYHPDSRKRKLYYLTCKGKDLIHVLVPLVRWALKYHGDEARIPPAQQAALASGPEGFIQATLAALEDWESAFEVDTKDAATRV
ncbi:winged helix-turn-helix transcriptional regulator [Ketobacter sp.]|uniref:winged helix-turn-helix transcriptional regulator n=1 Tax=Ketobacter sp. TaxID=2083498 RepID=UPI000F1D1720|nr:helix-turn-helix domain-containing protein [Ketobacter sp.]RLU00730.1 MAG: transcriptional regulator [Ketobacter sp.]